SGQRDGKQNRCRGRAQPARRVKLEIALGGTQHDAWQTPGVKSGSGSTPAEMLRRAGWQVADAASAAGSLDEYRRYVATSKAEWSVAKHGYVAGRSGWFSCRSACYLAAGRPVVVEDTGFSSVLPTGEGIVAFSSPEEAVDTIRDVSARYDRHARAARALAAEYFDSDRVLTQLVEQAMSGSRPTPITDVVEAR